MTISSISISMIMIMIMIMIVIIMMTIVIVSLQLIYTHIHTCLYICVASGALHPRGRDGLRAAQVPRPPRRHRPLSGGIL